MTSPRRSFEQRVGPLVVLLARMPKAVPFLLVAGLLVVGLLVQGVLGGVLLLVLALLLGSLLALSWPALHPQPRAIRTAVVALVAARAVTFLL
ncbi:MAG TPA: DUF6703 family protein [Mycobacteriales bacterium]|nr:DUF6703 family protein [Mycobacteriales bacterium]